MVERIRTLIERYPEDPETVRLLIEADPLFDAMCQEYAEIAVELSRISPTFERGAAVQSEGLKMRRLALEEEILARVEGCRPT